MVNSRQKGARGEREARDAVREHWHSPECIRAAQSCGAWAADLLEALPGFHVEVKRYKRIAAMNFYRQAVRDAKGLMPVVLMREDGDTNWYVMFDIKHTGDFVDAFIQNAVDAELTNEEGQPGAKAGLQEGVPQRPVEHQGQEATRGKEQGAAPSHARRPGKQG